MKKLLFFFLIFIFSLNISFAEEKEDPFKDFYNQWYYYFNWFYIELWEDWDNLKNTFTDWEKNQKYIATEADNKIIEKFNKTINKIIIKKNSWEQINKIIISLTTILQKYSSWEIKLNDQKYFLVMKLLNISTIVSEKINFFNSYKDFENNINSISKDLFLSKEYLSYCYWSEEDYQFELKSQLDIDSLFKSEYDKKILKEYSWLTGSLNSPDFIKTKQDYYRKKSKECTNIISDLKKWYIFDWMDSISFYIFNSMSWLYKLQIENSNIWDYYCWDFTDLKHCFWISDWKVNNSTKYFK